MQAEFKCCTSMKENIKFFFTRILFICLVDFICWFC